MNVILVTRFYPPDTGGGGVAAYARYIALGLIQRGHQVRVISALGTNSRPHTHIAGVDIYRISMPLSSYRLRQLPIVGKHVRFLSDLIYSWYVRRKLYRLSKESRPDIVEYADIDAEAIFHPRELCPYVVKLHASHAILRPFYTDHEMSYALKGIEWLEAMAVKRADGVSSPSSSLATDFARISSLSVKDITWIPNGIDCNQYSPDINHQPQKPLVLYVGRLETRKGADVFAQAIPLIAVACPDVEFVFLGADRVTRSGASMKNELQAYFEIQGVSERVQFHGHAEPDTFRKFYQSATVFVMPSRYENCPYTLLEAMACGKPSVVSRAGGMPEITEHAKSGFLFNVGDSRALAEYVITLLKSPKLRDQMGSVARETVLTRYEMGIVAEATELFYRNIISRKET